MLDCFIILFSGLDSFACVIHKNDTLSDIEEMNYLKNLVGGKVEEIISSINLANANFKKTNN